MEFIKKIHETILKFNMLSDGDRVLIGLSGGPDSICLAVILDKLKEDFNLSLSAVYVDHGLRPQEIEKEVDFCQKFCDKSQIDFYKKSVNAKKSAEDEGLNLQEAARELRYKVYEEISNNIEATKIALGHNSDDQAETVLMRLLKGSGRKGLSGIPPVRGKIIRPLIKVERNEIEKFLNHHSQSYIIDPSNLKKDYFRNWIRLSLMHEIKKRNPSMIQSICRTANILQEEDDYLELIVTKTLMRLISRKNNDSIELFLSPLEMIEKPILRRILRRAINETKGLRGINFVHIEDIVKLVKEGRLGDRINLPKGIRVIKEYSILKITLGPLLKIGEYELQLPCEAIIKEAEIAIKALFEEKGGKSGNSRSSVLLDAGNMHFPLKIRHRAAGDFFYPLGFGKRKKLQDFFVDEKVPRDERDKIPVVLSGNDIIWVAGYRADERFKVNERTEKFLRLIISKISSQ